MRELDQVFIMAIPSVSQSFFGFGKGRSKWELTGERALNGSIPCEMHPKFKSYLTLSQ